MNRIKYIAPVLIALTCLGLQQAKADTFSFNLSVGNPAVSGYPGPYASVTINRTSSITATITFTSLTKSGNIYLMGDGGSAAVNVNATTFTVGTITGTNSGTGFTPGPYSTSSGNSDGFGSFNLSIDSFDGFTSSADTISFTLTNTSGTWSSASQVLIANASGALVAAHIFVTASPADASAGALATGYAANGGATVPDGGTTVMLLGAALGALGMARRYLKS